ncbi:MAG TPA: ABC transporter ATP-binding protein [Actinomycetota bacterium]
MTVVVRTEGLRKVYGSTVALDAVSLEVAEGSVYGLVGPNGAGKSTLLGILAGLRRASSGAVEIATPRRRVAVMPDTPRFDPWITAREVVDLARALTAPEVPLAAVEEALAEAGLADVAARRVGGFSRGMLQRLGIAATIVSGPDLLMLDEPCSALDPLGRHEVLELVSRLGRRATVLFSSHILADVQRVCDTVGVLREGNLLYQGPLDRLLEDHVKPAYLVRLRSAPEPVIRSLRAESWVVGVTEEGRDEIKVEVSQVAAAETGLVSTLAAVGARVVSVEPVAADLESVFLEITS